MDDLREFTVDGFTIMAECIEEAKILAQDLLEELMTEQC